MSFNQDYKLLILEEHKLICTNWVRSVTSAEYREALLYTYRCIKEQELEYWLVDASLHNPVAQDQSWAVSEFGQMLIGTKLRKIGVIHNNDLLVELVAEIMQYKAYSTYGNRLDIKLFATTQEGLEFLLPEADTDTILHKLHEYAGFTS